MSEFACECGREIPDELIIRLLRERIVLDCSGCHEKWDRVRILDSGVDCPCCDQLAKRYRRKINAGMARILIWLARESGTALDWVHVAEDAPTFVRKSNEVSRLRLWDLVEEKPHGGDTSRRTSGVWRPTPKGVRFAEGQIQVPTLIVYNNVIEGETDERATIRDALGKKFNYAELMGATP